MNDNSSLNEGIFHDRPEDNFSQKSKTKKQSVVKKRSISITNLFGGGGSSSKSVSDIVDLSLDKNNNSVPEHGNADYFTEEKQHQKPLAWWQKKSKKNDGNVSSFVRNYSTKVDIGGSPSFYTCYSL